MESAAAGADDGRLLGISGGDEDRGVFLASEAAMIDAASVFAGGEEDAVAGSGSAECGGEFLGIANGVVSGDRRARVER